MLNCTYTVCAFHVCVFILFTISFFNRLASVQTEDELRDVYHHFMLYYGRDVVAMKNKKISQASEQLSLEEDETKELEKTSVKHAKRCNVNQFCVPSFPP